MRTAVPEQPARDQRARDQAGALQRGTFGVGLTSGLFLWLTIMLAGGAIAGTTWLWARLAWAGIGQVGARIALIAARQILNVAAVLAYLNDSFSFFTPWSAQVGPAPPRQSPVPRPATAPART